MLDNTEVGGRPLRGIGIRFRGLGVSAGSLFGSFSTVELNFCSVGGLG